MSDSKMNCRQINELRYNKAKICPKFTRFKCSWKLKLFFFTTYQKYSVCLKNKGKQKQTNKQANKQANKNVLNKNKNNIF